MTLPSRARGTWRFRAGRPSPSFHVLEPVQRFIHTEVTGGAVLLACAVAALVLANSAVAEHYHEFWSAVISLDLHVLQLSGTLHYWVNDGLMTLFFFSVSLEIKRELVVGELSNGRRALVPAAAALGGMIVPALLFLALNAGGPGARGWGVPMATDIAFSLGVLALLGDRVPNQVRVFLLAVAIVDDVGAIVVIALFYSGGFDPVGLVAALSVVAVSLAARLAGVRTLTVYWGLGIALWYALASSGIHPTLAGVVMAFLTPVRPDFDHGDFHALGTELVARFETAHEDGGFDDAESALGQIEELTRRTEAPLERLQRSVHPWSTFIVLPLFALANAGVTVDVERLAPILSAPVFLGAAVGLAGGKVLGIVLGTRIAVTVLGGALPRNMTPRHVAGVGCLAGVGFTVALFIADLAFTNVLLTEHAKLGILTGSAIAALIGYTLLRATAAGRAP